MEIDLSVRGSDGTLRDVRLRAADGTSDAELLAALGLPTTGPALRSGMIVGEPPGRAGAPWRVVVCGGPDAGRAISLTGQPILAGRSDEADLALSDPAVSRGHLEITASGRRVLVRDLGSRNGSFLDGERLDDLAVEVIPGQLLRMGDTLLRVETPSTSPAGSKPLSDRRILVNPAPDQSVPAEAEVIDLPEPPEVRRAARVQWIGALAPAVGAAALAYWMGSVMFLLFAVLSPLALIAAAASDRHHGRRTRRRAAAEHRAAMAAATARVESALRAEQQQRRSELPDPATVLATAELPGRALWSRQRGPGLLTLRLGYGPSESRLRTRRDGALSAAGAVTEVPVAGDLGEGPLGIAGPRKVATAAARWCVLQMAVAISPSELDIVPLVRGREWRWLRWLPHVRAPAPSDPVEQRTLARRLLQTVTDRETERSLSADNAWPGPWTLVLLEDEDGRGGLGADLADVLARGSRVGVTAVCVEPRAAALPAECATTVEVAGDGGTRIDLRHRGSSRPVAGVADRVTIHAAERAARALTSLVDPRDSTGQGLPDRCSLEELLGVPDPAAVTATWRSDPEAAPVAALGVSVDGTFEIDLLRDGPHALVAGTTGSGKSELLRTWVISLAARHPPDTVQFLLVDYKGGAAFAECADLPHCTGLVTDLDSSLVRRALVSLRAELRRREELFAESGADDLAGYLRSGGRRCPRLVIVVDEFAGLVEELPEFITGLIGIAQRGRSLGVHLILATQRPGGVVSADIRANTSLRVALRVTSGGDSTEVLDNPAAARVSPATPGRGFVRRAEDLVAVQFASASIQPMRQADGVQVIELDEWRRPRAADLGPARPSETGGPTPLSAWVEAIRTASGAMRPAPLWQPPLPDRLPMADLPAVPAGVAIGLADLPAELRQVPYRVDLADAAPLLICGGPRSGRSSALLTLAVAATSRWGPDELHLHAIDCGGALAVLARLPHIGTLAVPEHPELIDSLLGRLDLEVRDRLSRRDVTGPRLLLLVDGWNRLSELDERAAGPAVETLDALVRDGPAAGLTVVLAGDRETLAPRVSGSIARRLVLPLADPADYAVAGIPARAVPEHRPAGRALTPQGHEVQLAIVDGAASATRWPPAREGPPLRLQPLPREVGLDDLPIGSEPGTVWLGAGGDSARPVGFAPFQGGGRLLVAGPPRSGRSTVLRTIAAQRGHGTELVLAAPRRSPLAREHGSAQTLLSPESAAAELAGVQGPTLLLVDDCEAFVDTEIGDALAALLRRGPEGPDGVAAVVAGRNDMLAVTHRGLPVQARQFGCGVLLQPGPLDGDLVGATLPRHRSAPRLPGRGLLVPDPAWSGGTEPLPLQVARRADQDQSSASSCSNSWVAYQESSKPSASSTDSCAESSPRSAASIALAAAATADSASASSMWMDAT